MSFNILRYHQKSLWLTIAFLIYWLMMIVFLKDGFPETRLFYSAIPASFLLFFGQWYLLTEQTLNSCHFLSRFQSNLRFFFWRLRQVMMSSTIFLVSLGLGYVIAGYVFDLVINWLYIFQYTVVSSFIAALNYSICSTFATKSKQLFKLLMVLLTLMLLMLVQYTDWYFIKMWILYYYWYETGWQVILGLGFNLGILAVVLAVRIGRNDGWIE